MNFTLISSEAMLSSRAALAISWASLTVLPPIFLPPMVAPSGKRLGSSVWLTAVLDRLLPSSSPDLQALMPRASTIAAAASAAARFHLILFVISHMDTDSFLPPAAGKLNLSQFI